MTLVTEAGYHSRVASWECSTSPESASMTSAGRADAGSDAAASSITNTAAK